MELEQFRSVKEQTHEICLAAVQYDGLALRFVKEQTPELCLAAIQRDENALQYVRIPHKKPCVFDDCHHLQEPFKENTCCICYNDILEEKKEIVGCLQCKQPFHNDCLGNWFHPSEKSSCPACKNTNWKHTVGITFDTV